MDYNTKNNGMQINSITMHHRICRYCSRFYNSKCNDILGIKVAYKNSKGTVRTIINESTKKCLQFPRLI